MNKNHFMVLGISVLAMITIAIIVFLLMLPKQSSAVKGTIKPYEQIQKTQYTFEATRDITSEPLKKQYSVSSDDMSSFRYKNQYVPGNTDPFAEINSGSGSESSSSKGGNSSGSSGSSSSSGGNGESSEQAKQEATDKSTNSNGGTPNPASTGK